MLISKDVRQVQVVENIIKFKARCYIDIIMGFGKTRIAILLLQRALEKVPDLSILIVVPTESLKIQWEDILSSYGIPNFRVVVINTIALKNDIVNCGFCIVDEANQGIRAEQFGSIYKKIKSRGLVLMSGTWSYKDKQHLALLNMPCADYIGEREAIQNKWIAARNEYCLEVELSEKDRVIYDSYLELLDSTFAYFGHDWDTLMNCLNIGKAQNYIAHTKMVLKYDNGQVMTLAQGGRYLASKANIYLQTLKKRNAMINNSPEKLEKVVELLKHINDIKTVTFGLNTTAADLLEQQVPNSISYHSYIKGKEFDNELLLKYDFPIKIKKNTTKLSKDSTKNLYIKMLERGEFNSIHTVKSFDVGIDVQGLNCAIVYARVSQKERQNQRLARSSRFEGDSKLAIFIHIVLKDTQDEKWYKKSTEGKFGIKMFNNVENLINTINNDKKLKN